MHLIFIVFACLIATSSPDCKKFREGKFQLLTGGESNHTITRSKNKQLETRDDNGFTSEMEIKWTSECTYLLFDRKIVKGEEYLDKDIKIDTLYNEIIYVNADTCRVKSRMRGFDLEVESTILRIDKP